MASTDTLPSKTGEAGREAPRTPKRRHLVLTWVAVLAAVVAVTALAVSAVGSHDDSSVPVTRHYQQGKVHDRRARLEDQAWTTARDAASARRIAADQRAASAERRAHLEGQARTIPRQMAARSDSPRATRSSIPTSTVVEPETQYLPGSRHMPTR